VLWLWFHTVYVFIFSICFMQWISHVTSSQILMFQFDAVKWCCHEQWPVITVLSIAQHHSLMQSSEPLLLLQNIFIEVVSYLSLENCFCTHSLVVDHIGCSINIWICSILLFLLSMLCSVRIQLSKLECFFVFHYVTLEVANSWWEAVGIMRNIDW